MANGSKTDGANENTKLHLLADAVPDVDVPFKVHACPSVWDLLESVNGTPGKVSILTEFLALHGKLSKGKHQLEERLVEVSALLGQVSRTVNRLVEPLKGSLELLL